MRMIWIFTYEYDTNEKYGSNYVYNNMSANIFSMKEAKKDKNNKYQLMQVKHIKQKKKMIQVKVTLVLIVMTIQVLYYLQK